MKTFLDISVGFAAFVVDDRDLKAKHERAHEQADKCGESGRQVGTLAETSSESASASKETRVEQEWYDQLPRIIRPQ